jgi:hypothetical protein
LSEWLGGFLCLWSWGGWVGGVGGGAGARGGEMIAFSVLGKCQENKFVHSVHLVGIINKYIARRILKKLGHAFFLSQTF